MNNIVIGICSLFIGWIVGFLMSSLCVSCSIRDKEEEIIKLQRKLYNKEEFNESTN